MAYGAGRQVDMGAASARGTTVRERVHPNDLDPRPTLSAESEPDDLFELGERCAEIYMQADALHAEAMALLAEFDERRGWKNTAFGSTAEWLAWRIGITLSTAQDRLRVARSLRQLPQTAQALRDGRVSYSKVRAAVRVARSDNESQLLELAASMSASGMEREIRSWKTMDRSSELTAEQIRHRTRKLSVFVDDDGMYVVTGRVDPEVGVLLMRAIEAASDAIYRPDGKVGGRVDDGINDVAEQAKPEQRRADAIGLIAERALCAGFGGAEVSNRPKGVRAERYQVVLHVDEDTLSADREPGRSELEDGTRLSAETARRLACDAGVVRMGRGADGAVLSVGRRTRSVSPSLRRALVARDRGCRFPACGARFTEGHHVVHWADGGETSLRNTLSLCRRHHRAVHEGQVRVCLNHEGQAAFIALNGTAIQATPPVRERPVRVTVRIDPGRDHLPWHRKGAARYADSQVPLYILNRARESL